MQNRARFRDCLFYDPAGVPTPSIRQFVLRGKMGRAAAKTVTKSAPCKYSSHTHTKKKKVSARSLPSTEISVRQSQGCVDLRLKLIICSDKRASLGGLQWVNAVIVDLFKRLDTFIRLSMGSRTFLCWQDKNQGGLLFFQCGHLNPQKNQKKVRGFYHLYLPRYVFVIRTNRSPVHRTFLLISLEQSHPGRVPRCRFVFNPLAASHLWNVAKHTRLPLWVNFPLNQTAPGNVSIANSMSHGHF